MIEYFRLTESMVPVETFIVRPHSFESRGLLMRGQPKSKFV